MSGTFRCGHPRTPENIKKFSSTRGERCATCYKDAIDRYRLSHHTKARPGRPQKYFSEAAIAHTPEDIAYREMVTRGTEMLGAAVDKLARKMRRAA